MQQLPEDDPRYAKIAALWKSRSALGTATERASAPKLEAEPPVLPTDNVELPQQLTPEQAVQMRAQMLAYKALSKNAPVAPVLQAVRRDCAPHGSTRLALTQLRWPCRQAAAGVPVSVPPTRIDANGGVVSAEDAQATHDRLVEVRFSLSLVERVRLNAHGVCRQKLLSAYSQHQLQQQLGHRRGSLQDPLRIIDAKRLIVSTKAPLGLDPAQAIEQRDALAAVRIEQRIKELRSVPSNLPAEQKTRALIELKALKLLEFQRRMREEVLNSIQQNTSLEIGANRNMYKRVRRHAVREARMTERLERQQQLDREARERQRTKKHRDHLASIMQHAKEFKEYHRAHSNKASRCAYRRRAAFAAQSHGP